MSKYKTKFLPAVAALFSLAIVGAVGANMIPSAPQPPIKTDTPIQQIDTSHIQEMSMGSEDAPITMIEYASYTCSHCANFNTRVLPQLKKDFVDTGKVRLITREVFTHKSGLWGAMIARCEDGKNFHEINDAIYAQQSEWIRAASAEDMIKLLKEIGTDHGLTAEEVEACTSSEEDAMAIFAHSQKHIEADEIRGTPTFIINGRTFPNQSYDKLKDILSNVDW